MQLKLTMALAALRIITGLLIAYHGLELFDSKVMENYLTWERIQALPQPKAWVVAGKAAELAGGLALALGLFTRYAALTVMCVFLFITFYLGNGKFWYQDQHPFLFALIAALYAVAGSGVWSMDEKILSKKRL